MNEFIFNCVWIILRLGEIICKFKRVKKCMGVKIIMYIVFDILIRLFGIIRCEELYNYYYVYYCKFF